MFKMSLVRIAALLTCLIVDKGYASDPKSSFEFWEDVKLYGANLLTTVGPSSVLSFEPTEPNANDLLSSMPKDLRLKVLGYLDRVDQRSITRVSKRFHQDWKTLQQQEINHFKNGQVDLLTHFPESDKVLEAVLYHMWKSGDIARLIPVVPVDYSLLDMPDDYKPELRTFSGPVENYLNHLLKFPDLIKLIIAETLDLDPAVEMHRVMLISAVVERLEETSEPMERLYELWLDYIKAIYIRRSNGKYMDWDEERQDEFIGENSNIFPLEDQFTDQIKADRTLKPVLMCNKVLALSGDKEGVRVLDVFANSVILSSRALAKLYADYPDQPNWACYTDFRDAIRSMALMIRRIQVTELTGHPGLKLALNFSPYVSTVFGPFENSHLTYVHHAAREFLLCQGRFQEAWECNAKIIDACNIANTDEVKWALLSIASGEKLDLIEKGNPEIWNLYQQLMRNLELEGGINLHASHIRTQISKSLTEMLIQEGESLDEEKQKLELRAQQWVALINRYKAQAILVFNDKERMGRVGKYIQDVESLLPENEEELCFATYYKSSADLWDKEKQYVCRKRNNALRAAHDLAECRFEDAYASLERGAEVTSVLLASLKRHVGNTEFPEKLKSLVGKILVASLEEDLNPTDKEERDFFNNLGMLRLYKIVFTDDFTSFYQIGDQKLLASLAECLKCLDHVDFSFLE